MIILEKNIGGKTAAATRAMTGPETVADPSL
jgi:hypothetical protein